MSFKKVDRPLKGDLLRVHRQLGYYHFGVAVSEDRVIHFSAPEQDITDKTKMRIIETPLKDFLKGDELEVWQPYDSSFSREEVVKRAKKHVNSNRFRNKYYNVVTNNCEHFARYCYYDKNESKQVVTVTVGAAIMGAILAGAAVTGIATKKAKKNSANIETQRKEFKNSA